MFLQVHPNPKRPPDLKLKLYEFAGKIVGKCLFESSLGRPYRQLVKARFSKSFLAQLMGLRVNYKVRLVFCFCFHFLFQFCPSWLSSRTYGSTTRSGLFFVFCIMGHTLLASILLN